MAVRARTSLTLGRPPHEDEHHATESTEAGDCQERLVDGWFKGIVAEAGTDLAASGRLEFQMTRAIIHELSRPQDNAIRRIAKAREAG